jgi:hypothetical protein
LPGTQILSVREYIGGIAGSLDSRAVADSAVGAAGLLYAVVALVVATVLGSARLARYEVRGAE